MEAETLPGERREAQGGTWLRACPKTNVQGNKMDRMRNVRAVSLAQWGDAGPQFRDKVNSRGHWGSHRVGEQGQP